MVVLVVDDHDELLDLVERALRGDGHEVCVASTVEQARQRLTEHAVALIVLDLGLPDGSGVELCRALRDEGRSLPILVLTASNTVASRVATLDAGADDHLGKPFALAELRARVRALLRRGRAPGPGRVELGDGLVLDFGTRRAIRAGRAAPITAREWAILEVLTAANGLVVSRPRLIEQAWPAGKGGQESSLEVLISRLRRKLGRDVIRTVRGRGYALRER